MSKFLSLGVVATTPLVAVSSYYLWAKKNRFKKNLDESIILVSKADGNFVGSCSQYAGGGAIGDGHQQLFNNSDSLWRYLFPNIESSPPESLKVEVPDEVAKNSRTIQTRQNSQPVTIWEKTLKEHWDMWISDWSPRAEGIKKVVYTDKRFETDPKQNPPKIEKLYKCHEGTTWYSLSFNSLPPEPKSPRN